MGEDPDAQIGVAEIGATNETLLEVRHDDLSFWFRQACRSYHGQHTIFKDALSRRRLGKVLVEHRPNDAAAVTASSCISFEVRCHRLMGRETFAPSGMERFFAPARTQRCCEVDDDPLHSRNPDPVCESNVAGEYTFAFVHNEERCSTLRAKTLGRRNFDEMTVLTGQVKEQRCGASCCKALRASSHDRGGDPHHRCWNTGGETVDALIQTLDDARLGEAVELRFGDTQSVGLGCGEQLVLVARETG